MSSTFQTAIGRAIAAERGYLGINQTQLGERLNLSRSAVSDIENGATSIPAANLPEWCEALECGVMDLFRRAAARDKRALRI